MTDTTGTTDRRTEARNGRADTANGRAILAKRSETGPVETEELRGLARTAGFAVAGAVTQVRSEDPGTNLGSGKLAELRERVTETGSDAVLFDNELTPAQHLAIVEALPADTRVMDRYRLVLEIFGQGAETRRAQLQVELARLRYDLPRIEERTDVAPMNRRTEKGSPVYDVRDRIDRLETELAELPDPAEQFRERRREQGFDLVTIAGYTNAGKSTLLHRLADDLDLEDHEPDHPDRDPVAAIEDRLFETLATTTRRATLSGRPTLLTDTVGLVRDLPHWLVESFSATLSEVAAADAVVLVADASDPVDELREKLRVALDVLSAQGVDPDSVVVALNKVDVLDPAAVADRREAIADLAPDPVETSVTGGTGIDALEGRILDELPTERAELVVPNGDAAMSLVSWLYESLAVQEIEYSEEVRVVVSGRPEMVEQARAKAREVRGDAAVEHA